MAGGSPAPIDREDTASHINPTYDSDEDGVVESADDADTVDGQHGGEMPRYATLTDAQNATLREGTIVFIQDTNEFYYEDGT